MVNGICQTLSDKFGKDVYKRQVPKVVNNGEGSALMRSPKLAEKIFTALIKKVHKPVTVKFRKGFDDSSVNAVEIAKIAEALSLIHILTGWWSRIQRGSWRR